MSNDRGFEHIVVAFDGSKDSVKAVQVASSLAAKFKAKVTIVHVYGSPAVIFAAGPGMTMPDYKDLEDAAKQTGQSVLEEGVRLATKVGVKANGELLEGPSVVEALIGFAANEKADLIVVGTRGMTGFKKLVLGSVSSGLVGHAHCPVMVVR